ncbi:hypothetical protein [Methylosinus sporium]|uniref:hypothetical protein n=1 Tax=Methylosinus sporium TaxID=428 RepID=UPI00383B8948
MPIERLLSAIIVALLLATPAASEERQTFGIEQFKIDRGGSEAVLCSWTVYLSVQAATKSCELTRRPTDDAIDEAILAIDDFILANAALHPTREALEAFKGRIAAAMTVKPPAVSQKLCENSLEFFRSRSPEAIRSSVKASLASALEPSAGPVPCL